MPSADFIYGEPTTRHRILEAAWEAIEDLGSKTRLADAAERAGVSRQAVYLHFGDRSGLLTALVEHMDEKLGLEELVAHVFKAPSGAEALDRMVELHAIYSPKVESVVRVLQAAQFEDEALAGAWRNRIHGRRAVHRAVMERIAEEGRLAEGWTVDTAADISYSMTLPETWRELTEQRGWTAEQYAQNISMLLRNSLVTGGSGPK